jgi:hypothetical protein
MFLRESAFRSTSTFASKIIIFRQWRTNMLWSPFNIQPIIPVSYSVCLSKAFNGCSIRHSSTLDVKMLVIHDCRWNQHLQVFECVDFAEKYSIRFCPIQTTGALKKIGSVGDCKDERSASNQYDQQKPREANLLPSWYQSGVQPSSATSGTHNLLSPFHAVGSARIAQCQSCCVPCQSLIVGLT